MKDQLWNVFVSFWIKNYNLHFCCFPWVHGWSMGAYNPRYSNLLSAQVVFEVFFSIDGHCWSADGYVEKWRTAWLDHHWCTNCPSVGFPWTTDGYGCDPTKPQYVCPCHIFLEKKIWRALIYNQKLCFPTLGVPAFTSLTLEWSYPSLDRVLWRKNSFDDLSPNIMKFLNLEFKHFQVLQLMGSTTAEKTLEKRRWCTIILRDYWFSFEAWYCDVKALKKNKKKLFRLNHWKKLRSVFIVISCYLLVLCLLLISM